MPRKSTWLDDPTPMQRDDLINNNTANHQCMEPKPKPKKVRVASIKITGTGGTDEIMFFEEPDPGTKQGTVVGKRFQFDFFILDSGNWHLIVYKAGDNTKPLTSMEVDFAQNNQG